MASRITATLGRRQQPARRRHADDEALGLLGQQLAAGRGRRRPGSRCGTPSSTSPASRPAFVLSMTEVISYRSDWRTSPLAVLPSISAKLTSQKTVALRPRQTADGRRHRSSWSRGSKEATGSSRAVKVGSQRSVKNARQRGVALAGGAAAEFAEARGRRPATTPTSRFRGLGDDTDAGWRDLAALVGSSGMAVLFRAELPQLPAAWTRLDGGRGHQMVLRDPPSSTPPRRGAAPRSLGRTTWVRCSRWWSHPPGPVHGAARVELGGYLGVFDGDRLMAMAGQRLAPPGFAEISAVCTHPDFRGPGARRRAHHRRGPRHPGAR